MKTFKGKAIYNPSGKAGEYSYWACNFYVGCSNGCEYCYCKKGILAGAMGQDKPQLKKCFRDEDHAVEVFQKELLGHIEELREHGLFFSFTTDPMLPKTMELTFKAINTLITNGAAVKVLSKRSDWVDDFLSNNGILVDNGKAVKCHIVSFGFTLTGHNELEPGASTNAERIEAMKKLHEAGFKTFASIEPIIDFESSKEMIRKTAGYCDLYKIGLESGKKYDKVELLEFINYCNSSYMTSDKVGFYKQKNYFKDSLLKHAGIDRETLPGNCVGRDYNIFK